MEEVSAEENLDGLSEDQLETFRQRALPEPGGVLRDTLELTNDARLDLPSTIVCTGYTSEQYKEAMGEGYAWLAGLQEVRNLTWVDLPTSHWPMWSRPEGARRDHRRRRERTPPAADSRDRSERTVVGFEDLMRDRSAAQYADFVLPAIGRGDQVLDVGCGPGSITLGIAEAAGHVTGIDVDDAEFADGRAYAADHGIGNVEFREGTIYDLGVPEGSIDVCTLFAMLETLDDPLAGLARSVAC